MHCHPFKMEQLMRGAALNPNQPLFPKCCVIIAAALLPLFLSHHYELGWSSDKFQHSLTNYARTHPITPPASWRDVPSCGYFCNLFKTYSKYHHTSCSHSQCYHTSCILLPSSAASEVGVMSALTLTRLSTNRR